ncbi:hypothetical protein QYE76_061836 [Lolium multiflorum]|uniref:Uncharacterized protein n=1 Tax=Lolium multiflorum TaxID=4521 RepID=A0AAD8S1J1_LOLMU|nr:hypothetical protein QYE76_061836 [Lolium multiflorum]
MASGVEEEGVRPEVEEEEEDDDERPQLSAAAVMALREFLEQRLEGEKGEGDGGGVELVPEGSRLSQSWYDDAPRGSSRRRSPTSPSACVACPTLYAYLKKGSPDMPAQLLEYDERFGWYGGDFTFYDYNQPEELPPTMKQAYRIVVADPPYLEISVCPTTAPRAAAAPISTLPATTRPNLDAMDHSQVPPTADGGGRPRHRRGRPTDSRRGSSHGVCHHAGKRKRAYQPQAKVGAARAAAASAVVAAEVTPAPPKTGHSKTKSAGLRGNPSSKAKAAYRAEKKKGVKLAKVEARREEAKRKAEFDERMLALKKTKAMKELLAEEKEIMMMPTKDMNEDQLTWWKETKEDSMMRRRLLRQGRGASGGGASTPVSGGDGGGDGVLDHSTGADA